MVILGLILLIIGLIAVDLDPVDHRVDPGHRRAGPELRSGRWHPPPLLLAIRSPPRPTQSRDAGVVVCERARRSRGLGSSREPPPAPSGPRRRAGRRARPAPLDAVARPVRERAGRRTRAWDGAVAESAAVTRAGSRSDGRRRVCGRRVPLAGVAHRRDHGHSRRRPVGSGCSRLAAAGGARRLPRRAVGRDPRAAPRARTDR